MVDNLENLNPRPEPSFEIQEVEPFLNAQLRPEQWNELLAVLEVLHIKIVDTQDGLVDIQNRLARIEKHLGVVKPVPPVPGRRDLQI